MFHNDIARMREIIPNLRRHAQHAVHPAPLGHLVVGVQITMGLLVPTVRDEHEAIIRSDAPPGDYRIIAGLWDGYTGERMHVLDANGNVTDQDGIVLTTKFIVQP